MHKWTIDSDGALDIEDELSPKRETFIERMEEISFELETSTQEAFEIFNEMPEITLPPLPWGYMWTRNADDQYCIIRDKDSFDHYFDLILFGPNAHDQINFLFQVDEVTTYSFAHTNKGTGPSGCTPPMSYFDYRVPDYDYSRARYKQHVRGHLIDLHDTIRVGLRHLWSAVDHRNFIPEPPEYEWGMGIRNQKVRALRRLPYPTAYAQYSLYPDRPLKTNDNTWVPEEVFFTSFSIQGNVYKRLDSIDVNWVENMKRPTGQKILDHAAAKLTTSLSASPVVETYTPDSDDRTLRKESRNHVRTANFIASGTYQARFPQTSEMSFRFFAADKEFEHITHQLRATITADKAEKSLDAIHNLDRSLNNGEVLADLDEDGELISNAVRRSSLDLIRRKEGDEKWAGSDLDDITDRLNSIWRP